MRQKVMKRGLFSMTQREVERISIIEQAIAKQIKQGEAGRLLKVTSRQIRRMVKAYRKEGINGLVSKHRGRVSNHHHDESTREQIKGLVHQHYADFGPTLAAEKLRERDGLSVNKETLRQWMIEWGLWQAKRQKQAKLHQSRARRACFGELIQLDGSHHDWFEGRREKCCLLVLIDDATSRLVGLRFEEGETTAGYFHVVREYIEKQGRPLAFYSDKYGVFRVNHPDADTASETQFGRAMRELGIELICANSPQAKGRVERANGTLQDRLIKEMRLQGISTIETANAFLATFMADYNERFAVVAKSEINAHRKGLPDPATLDCVLSSQSVRTLSKNLELSYQDVIYQVKTDGKGYRLRHAKVVVCERMNGTICLVYQGRELPYTCHQKQKRTAEIVGAKQLGTKLDQVKKQAEKYVPPKHHPWRHYVINPMKAGMKSEEKDVSYPQGKEVLEQRLPIQSPLCGLVNNC
jgi:transposase